MLSIHQLRACGLDGDAVARRVRDGRLHRLYRGVYAVGHRGLTLRGRFRAAVLACRDEAVLSHFAAAAFWELWTWEERRIDVTVPGSARDLDGVRVHRTRGLERDVLARDGMRVTMPARTLLDLAAILPAKALRSLVRRAQAQGAVAIRQIVELLARLNGIAAPRSCARSSPTGRRPRARSSRTSCTAIPIRVWCWPGNQSEQELIRQVKDDCESARQRDPLRTLKLPEPARFTRLDPAPAPAATAV